MFSFSYKFIFTQILKCISQLELAQLFGVNVNKAKLSVANHHHQHHHHHPNTLVNNPTASFSLPFDNLFHNEKSMCENSVLNYFHLFNERP